MNNPSAPPPPPPPDNPGFSLPPPPPPPSAPPAQAQYPQPTQTQHQGIPAQSSSSSMVSGAPGISAGFYPQVPQQQTIAMHTPQQTIQQPMPQAMPQHMSPQLSSSSLSSGSIYPPNPQIPMHSPQHSMQQSYPMNGMNQGAPPQGMQPIQVPGQGTMYPTMGPNGQIVYSFQPPDTQQGGMQGMGMQGGMQGMGMQQGAMQGVNGMGMQGGMNGMGMQGGMNGMGAMQGGMNGMGSMQSGMNGMGMQTGMNGMAMQPGMNGVGGMQGSMNGMGMQTGMNGMAMQPGMNGVGGMQGGINGMGMVQQPPIGGHAGSVMAGGGLQLKAVGGFKDMNSQIHDLPEVAITNADEAGNRLFALKSKLNELQAKHDSYKSRQIANGGVAAASALFTFGTSLLVQGPAAVHQHNRMQTIKRAMGPCIQQINMLRESYGNHPSWQQREATVTITEKIFTGGVNRNDLKGAL